MWIVIAIAAVGVLALAYLIWHRSPRVADDVQSWKHDLEALRRTASAAPVGGPPPAPAEPAEPGDTVRVLGRPGRDDA